MTTYLGPVGNLQAVPDNGALKRAFAIPTSVHEIAGTRGGRVVDRVGTPKATYTADLTGLTQDEVSVWEGLALNAYGLGPHVLLEPWRRNLLTANQSTGTDTDRDTSGFVANAGTLSTSGSAFADMGSRSLIWDVTALNQKMMTGALSSITAADPAVDIPVLPNTVYSARVRARALTGTPQIRLDMRWFTAAGVFISESTGTATVPSTAGFTDVPCLSITSPATAALLRLKVENTVAPTTNTFYLDKWQLQFGATLDAWTVGTGVPRVSFTEGFDQSYSVHPYVNGSVTLVEV